MNYDTDERIVLTLDAGGTNFAFSAIQRGKKLGESVILPAEANDLDASLNNLISGFQKLIDQLPQRPVAISFAFPGPADYPRGVIYNVGNLPAYKGGVAIGPMLSEHFKMPVYLNNDGDLFAYGEAIAGLLPDVNRRLEEAGSPKRYQNLFAVTLGTGFGGGIVFNGQLLTGDNSAGGEIWTARNKVHPEAFAEEGASARAVQGVYANEAGIDPATAPTPAEIFEIGMGQAAGNQAAAKKSFETLGEVVGDALASAMMLLDGLAVIGGGLAGAAPLFMPRLMQEMNSTMKSYSGGEVNRLSQKVYDLTDDAQWPEFLKGESKEITIPRSDRKMKVDPLKRIGVGTSTLGANLATAIGAYAFALQQMTE
ncbi:N-acetyl-D-glucosamine kinase [Planctomycetes bacterium CA13]|uniref:N-acetyl-D-glucosamine kinase n=1 Tax=Novipirellula herctigrandis TaxID=2527986 RepID=A0A5C5ZAT7_9BACT|nr:N-acetyl-D-glucosamine kinase [Planctomycetes bacterium CA13]